MYSRLWVEFSFFKKHLSRNVSFQILNAPRSIRPFYSSISKCHDAKPSGKITALWKQLHVFHIGITSLKCFGEYFMSRACFKSIPFQRQHFQSHYRIFRQAKESKQSKKKKRKLPCWMINVMINVIPSYICFIIYYYKNICCDTLAKEIQMKCFYWWI